MIILGTQEPRLDGPREIRRTDVALHHLLDGVTDEHPNVVITVPSASVMVTISKTKDRVGGVAIYYECDPDAPGDTKVELVALVNNIIDPGFRLLGHIWGSGDQLIAIYAKAMTRS